MVVLVVQLLSCVSEIFWPPRMAACQASLSFTISQSLLKNSCPLRQWCHLAIPSSVVPFSSYPRSFPASGSFPVSQFLVSGGQSIGASASVLPMNIQDWFSLGWTGWISLHSRGLSRIFSNTQIRKHRFFGAQPSLWSNSHICTWVLEKTVALTRRTFVGKVISLLFNMLSVLVIAFLPRSKRLLISWLQSLSTVILEPKKIKSVTVSIVSPSICHEVMGPDAMILVFWMLSFKPAFSLSSFTLIKRLFSFSSFSASRGVSSAYLRLLVFLLTVLIPACDSFSWTFCTMYPAYIS